MFMRNILLLKNIGINRSYKKKINNYIKFYGKTKHIK